ncbi:pyridoxamine 5'-phosphate oxidase family protein [Pseudophaeobacter flagellatus]|uniref:pyridoxamine 5'-phosphate oxidase family protein n=1 Tax=Pseudophaeobacter flagellatus TaxID=2899119 RepID=UPI001E2C4A70|nr:pyridoxamine 5'-phosphate oxidase family protein [Pseudophaeobacter flagellatus]MCD9148810.1 pyridoxamine 5'-phosphate oxidase family protein [Pseudophaeobacter flagellatus]
MPKTIPPTAAPVTAVQPDPGPSPFHAGEQALQRANGSRDRIEMFGRRAIRPYLPDQHRAFFAQLPFVAVAAVDGDGRPWASLFPGPPGFVHTPDEYHLDLALHGAAADPVRQALQPGAAIGLLGIEMHSRRRNRLNGRIKSLDINHIRLRVDQSFGNCPKYIKRRQLTPSRPATDSSPARVSARFTQLTGAVRDQIVAAEVFFVASAIKAQDNPVIQGVDVSHRGGPVGFVRIDGNSLIIPDYRGNNHFNTLGNFLLNPRAGLVFPDFDSGTLLQLTGRTALLAQDSPELQGFDDAVGGWRFSLDEGLCLQDALPFRTDTQTRTDQ